MSVYYNSIFKYNRPDTSNNGQAYSTVGYNDSGWTGEGIQPFSAWPSIPNNAFAPTGGTQFVFPLDLWVRKEFVVEKTALYEWSLDWDNYSELWIDGVLKQPYTYTTQSYQGEGHRDGLITLAAGRHAVAARGKGDNNVGDFVIVLITKVVTPVSPCEEVIVPDNPTFYWPLNDRSGTKAHDVMGDAFITLSGQAAFRPDGSGADFPGILNHSIGFDDQTPYERLSTTWAVEACVTPGSYTNFGYNYFGNSSNAQTVFYPQFRAGLPFSNLPPYGGGLVMGTNGWQILSHRGAYMSGPGAAMNLAGPHHVVLQGRPHPSNLGTIFTLHIDAVKVFEGQDQTDGRTYYPLRFGQGPYMSFEGSISNIALYIGQNLSQAKINNHFLYCSCLRPNKGWSVGRIEVS